MKAVLLFFALWFSSVSFSEAQPDRILIYVLSSNSNTGLAGKTQFHFRLQNIPGINPKPSNILFRTDVSQVLWENIQLDSVQSFEKNFDPGTYHFQFQIDGIIYEIESGGMTVQGNLEISVAFQFPNPLPVLVTPPTDIRVKVCKPVIYLHTDTKREFNLSVVPTEKFVFVYPEMNDSWKGTVHPTGNVSVNGVYYPYLFWESEQKYSFKSEGNGYKVEKSVVISFLEKKLTELGLNQQEKTDFITYWGPKLTANEASFVQFSIDDRCDQFATMTCSPKPTAVRRVYIQMAEWESSFDAYLNDVTFSPIQQSDWYIVEWGGFNFNMNQLALNEN